MKIQDIIDHWNNDVSIDPNKLDEASLAIPKLHAKYNQFLAQETVALKRLQRLVSEKTRERWEFYTGKATAAEYKQANFFIKVLKADVPMYLDSDKELGDLKERLAQQEYKVQLLKEIITSLNGRNWIIRNAIEWQRFINGLN